MSDATSAATAVVDAQATKSSAVAKSPKKRTAVGSKTKKLADHPKYSEMVRQALSTMKERGGSSRQAILKYIVKNFNVGGDEHVVNQHLKVALRSGVKDNSLKQSKGSGATGSFRLGAEAKKEKPTKDKKKAKPSSIAKKPAAAKLTKKKTTTATKKPAAKKPKTAAAGKAKAAVKKTTSAKAVVKKVHKKTTSSKPPLKKAAKSTAVKAKKAAPKKRKA